ncbi:MAG TPA: hypothetical protein ENN54_06625 [Thermoplasmatales archaeon]|nr:hypothetical protein [Thermoplasmatales archaeon]
MSFTVAEIMDGATFRVEEFWQWEGENGNLVRIRGQETPGEGQPGFGEVKLRLMQRLFGERVTLENPRRIDPDGALVCDVYHQGARVTECPDECSLQDSS